MIVRNCILTLATLAYGARNISDEEYRKPSTVALMPSPQYGFDRYEFREKGELTDFLPIDDDTWGEFLIKQSGFIAKYNFLQRY